MRSEIIETRGGSPLPVRTRDIRRVRRIKTLGTLFLVWVICVLVAASARAQTFPVSGGESTRETDPQPTEERVALAIRDIDARIQALESADSQPSLDAKDETRLPRGERINAWMSVRSTYERVQEAIRRKADQQKEIADLRDRIAQLEQRGMEEPPPYTLSFYDQLLNDLNAAEEDRENAADSVELARKRREDALQRLNAAQKTARRIRDRADSEFLSDGGVVSEKETFRAELEKTRAEAEFAQERVQLEVLQNKQAIENLRLVYHRKALERVRDKVAFDREDLEKQIRQLDIQKSALEDQLRNLRSEQRGRMEEFSEAVRADPREDSDLRKEIRIAHDAWEKTYQTIQEQIYERLRMLDRQKRIWELRYQVVRGETEYREASDWREESEASLEDLQGEINLQLKYLRNLQNQILAREKRLAEEDLGSEVRPFIREGMNALYRLKDERTDHIESASAAVMLEQKLLNEIDLKYRRLPLDEIWSQFLERFKSFLNIEIWVIDNRPLTIRKLAVGIIILLLGLAAAKFLIRMIQVRVLSDKLLQTGTGKALEKILTYFIYSMVVLFVLRIVNIPLEAFAFLGGALALGFGLGAQNLFNNFMSWFIIMAERTLTIGDLVEIDGLLGKVEDIGARHTRIRTGENIDILVPNSGFLEKNVVNWTLTDRKIRTHVSVGVIYGTPFRKVEELLLQAAEENAKVLKFPNPFVLFTDFGDNALVFEIHFWLYVERVVERKMVQSALRFRIGELFETAGLVIAFPQRDVHLDSSKPLEIRLMGEGESDAEKAPEAKKAGSVDPGVSKNISR